MWQKKHPPLNERELVRRVLAGEEQAFNELAERYFEGLYRFACSRLGRDRELTREVVQSTVCKAIRKLASYRGEAPLFTWLCACCRHEIADHFRRARRAPGVVALEDLADTRPAALEDKEATNPETALMREEAVGHVHEALDGLPQHYAQALEWKYNDGLSVAEIARRLDLSPKAAESVLTRARVAFRKAYTVLAGSWQRASIGGPGR